MKTAPRPAPAAPAPVPRMVEVAPNRYVQMDLHLDPPETIFCDLVPVEGQPGLFRLSPRSWERLERVTEELCAKLGLGRDSQVLRRLIRGGFVDGARVSPRSYTVNLASYFNHLKRCAEDPDYWENPKVMKQYQETYF